MATRFAGDFFGVGIDTNEFADNSELLKAFPELKNISVKPEKKEALAEFFSKKSYNNPQLTGGGFAPKPFAGFKLSGY